jgi:hypothetical protein
MRKRGSRHWHPLLDVVDAQPLRSSPHQQAENLQPARLPECAKLIDKIVCHGISSIIEISEAQAQRCAGMVVPPTFRSVPTPYYNCLGSVWSHRTNGMVAIEAERSSKGGRQV